MTTPALAVMISGGSILNFVVQLLIVGLCFWLINWLIDYCKTPDPINRILKVVVAVALVVIAINALLSLGGHGFIAW